MPKLRGKYDHDGVLLKQGQKLPYLSNLVVEVITINLEKAVACILWVDDIRIPPAGIAGCDIAHSYREVITLIENNSYDTIYLDHDLASFEADGKEKTGYDIVLHRVQRKMDGLLVPKNYYLLTANPVDYENMLAVINRYLV